MSADISRRSGGKSSAKFQCLVFWTSRRLASMLEFPREPGQFSRMRDFVLLYINGKPVEVRGDKTSMMLSDFLRYDRNLTGTKIVCAEGDCGACTVLRNFQIPGVKRVGFYEPVNSCITTVAQMDGSSLVTVDAIEEDGKLSPVQNAMVKCHGSQCGFCTPGFVMALEGLAEKKLACKESSITAREAKNYTTGNLCRCTGYQPIIDAAVAVKIADCKPMAERFSSKAQASHLDKTMKQALEIDGGNFSISAPRTLKAASQFLAKNSESKIISGGTDLGVLTNKGRFKPKKYLSLHLISEIYKITKTKNRLRVGARVTLSELRRACEDSVPEFARFLDLFASLQIKNVATLAGNVGNASPIADTPPFLLAANATQIVSGPKGLRKIEFDEFYLGYKKTALKKGEFIAYIEFDIPEKSEKLALYKSSQRKDLDISCVNAAFRLKFDGNKVLHARVAYGGVGATPYRLKSIEKLMEGKSIDNDMVEKAAKLLHKEIVPISDLRGSSAFRRVTAENFLRKFLSGVTQ
jgi:xanthine dehydrogenase small subunit